MQNDKLNEELKKAKISCPLTISTCGGNHIRAYIWPCINRAERLRILKLTCEVCCNGDHGHHEIQLGSKKFLVCIKHSDLKRKYR